MSRVTAIKANSLPTFCIRVFKEYPNVSFSVHNSAREGLVVIHVEDVVLQNALHKIACSL